jgi:hypothetical protein
MPITPTWTEVAVVGAETAPRTVALARGSTVRGALDLRAKHGALFFPRIGRTGVTALTNGVDCLIRRILGSTGVADLGQSQPASQVPLVSQAAAAVGTTVNTDSAAAQQDLRVASITSFAVGDYILIGANTAREEWGRISKLATGIITLDRPLVNTHTLGQADPVYNRADVFQPIWLMGGAVVEVIFDYGDDTAGEGVRVECRAQVYDSDAT